MKSASTWLKIVNDSKNLHFNNRVTSKSIYSTGDTGHLYQKKGGKAITNGTFVSNSITTINITKGSIPLYVNNPVSNNDETYGKLMAVNDIIEKFMEFCSDDIKSKEQFLNLPMKTFIAYTIMLAAEHEDQDASVERDIIKETMQSKPPRCLKTGKFLPRKAWDSGIRFISPKAMQDYMEDQNYYEIPA